MIKANELRVGNWIASQYKEGPFKVTGGLIAAMDDGMDEYSVEGVPLTPEILEKAGFEDMKDGDFCISIHLGLQLFLSIYPDGAYPSFVKLPEFSGCDHQVICVTLIYYLHQLQNLYFALTGEELTLDLCTNA